MNPDDNIPQTAIDLDAIEAETARMVEKYKLRNALAPIPETNDASDASEQEEQEEELPGTLIKLDDDMKKLSSYFDHNNRDATSDFPDYDDYQTGVSSKFADGWEGYDSDTDNNVEFVADWDDDGTFDAFKVDDDDTYRNKGKSGVYWDQKNHCYVSKDKGTTTSKWWEPQDDSEMLAGIADKMDEAAAQVDHISAEFAALESVVDEVSSTTGHTSRTVGKLAKTCSYNKELITQMAEQFPKAINTLSTQVAKMQSELAITKGYLKLLVDHFINQESDDAS